MVYYIYGGNKTYTRQTLEGARYLAEDLSYKEWCDYALVYNNSRYVGMSMCFRTVEDPNRNFYHQYNVWISTNNKIYYISGRGELGAQVTLKESSRKWALNRAKEHREEYIKAHLSKKR